VASLVVSALGLGVVMVGDRGTAQWRQAREEAQRLRSEIRQLQTENASLALRIADAERNSFELEKNARENLGLVRPDEIVFVLPPAASPTSAAR
jgi:cell division protein FtsB